MEKAFDYNEDIEQLGKEMDKKNREKLSKEDCDNVYISETSILEDINSLRKEEKDNFDKRIEDLKQEALKTEILFSSEDFDIFGAISEDKTKINTLGNIKHREIKKSKFRILDITKNTQNEQYIKRLKEIINGLDKALDKSSFGYNLNTYCASVLPLDTENYNILYINPKNALEELKNCEKVNLYNIKLNENTKAIPLTNIIYYDNNNRTLPLGMDISDKVLVDLRKLKLELKKQKLFRINQEIDDIEVLTKIICVYEYEVSL